MVPDATLSATGRAADAGAVGTALAGKAPADFGFYSPSPTSQEEFLAAINDCLLRMPSDSVRHVSIMYHGRHSITIHKHLASGYADIEDISYQLATVSSSATYYKRTRSLYNGVWKDWEYVNPPMQEGGEYRTTERFMGYPVYVRVLNLGGFSYSEQTSMAPEGFDWGGTVIDYYGYITNSSGSKFRTLPITSLLSMWVSDGDVTLIPNGLSSAYAGWTLYLAAKIVKQ